VCGRWPDLATAVEVDTDDDAMWPSGKMKRAMQAEDDFRNEFSGDFRLPAASLVGPQGNRPFSWRTGATAWLLAEQLSLNDRASNGMISRLSQTSCAQSQIACVGRLLQSQVMCARNWP
jgi:hypothetical protein